jgi:hypothetical protein
MQGKVLRLPSQRRAASADFLRRAEEGATDERIVAMVERTPLVVGNIESRLVQDDFHGLASYLAAPSNKARGRVAGFVLFCSAHWPDAAMG